jgi:formate-nitrite transporter family protein
MSKNSSDQLGLRQSEAKEVIKRTAIGAVVVHEAVRQEGEDEICRHPAALMWSRLAAGLSMGFSFLGVALIDVFLPADAAWKPLLTSAGYSLGFLIVILGRQQLFTENTLTAVLPLLQKWSNATLVLVGRLWGIVLISNLVGVLIFTLVIAHSGVMGPEVKASLGNIAGSAILPDFWTMVLKGIFAGWLIALMVWMLPGAESARVGIIFVMTYLVSLGGFPHVIAGSADALYATMINSISVGSYFSEYMLPALIGNVVGGVVLVAVINHLQAITGRTSA